MFRPKVLITNPEVQIIAFDVLQKSCDLIITENDKRFTILEKLSTTNGLKAIFWVTKETLDSEILDKAGPDLKTVATMSAGTNHINISELKKRGISLGNTPKVLDDSVADVAVMLALAASRRLQEGRLKIETGNWVPGVQWMMGQDISGSTVGIVGLGGIGQSILRRLKGFNVAKFLYSGHGEKQEGRELGAAFVSLDTLVRESDFIIVSCPLTPETTNLFNAEMFEKMKKTAIFVNIARGGIVDQQALIGALKGGKIFAAGLDVMTPEPLPSNSELLHLPNCVLLPHLGSATFKTRSAMAELTAKNILLGLEGNEMLSQVC